MAGCIQLDAQKAHAVKEPLKSESYISRYGNLDNALYHIKGQRKATIAFLGGSITHMKGWRDRVGNYLVSAYPGTAFTFLNAGIPSLGSLPHAFRLQRDVLNRVQPDLLFIESAVNDQVNGTPVEIQRRALEGIVRHVLKSSPGTNIVLMAFADESKVADYRAGKIPAEVQVHEAIAKYYHLPFINLAREVTDRIAAGEFSWEDDFKDLHPAPFGQRLYARTIRQLLEGAWKGKPVPQHVANAVLPPPADSFNYEKGRYLDIHHAINKKGFHIAASWQPADSINTRPGFVRVPMLVSGGGEASLELPFTGRAIGIAVVSGPDAGEIRYSIDGRPMQTADLHTEWSHLLYLPWYLLLGDGLQPEKHILRLQTGAQHRGSAKNICRIVYFLVNE